MLLQDLLEDLYRFIDLVFVVKNARTEDSNQRMFGFDLSTLSEFALSFFVLALIHENSSAVITRQHSFAGIQAHHAIETAQRLFIITIQTSNHAAHKPNTRIVRILIPEQLN